ncbi:PilZ domain-containing protein [candidate division KSB1 bacterium]|nr:PilZ domain-containing protein [candidate division KSB1 bacterium]
MHTQEMREASTRGRRRSQRLAVTIPLFVSSLDKSIEFAEPCETLDVSGHGCLIRTSKLIKPGISLRLDIPYSQRVATARSVRSVAERSLLKLGLELDRPHNLWGIHSPPEDWAPPERRLESRDREQFSKLFVRLGRLNKPEQEHAGYDSSNPQALLWEIQSLRDDVMRRLATAGEIFEQQIAHKRDQLLAQIHAELKKSIGEIDDRWRDSLEQSHARLRTEMQEFQCHVEERHIQLTQETHQFREFVHDAIIEAGGQIKGQIQLAIERINESRTRDVESTLMPLVDARVATVVQQVREETKHMLDKSLAELQTKISEAIDFMSRKFSERMGNPPRKD